MFRYKNTSLSVKTFYGVTFKPGDEKAVPGFINDSGMIRVKAKQAQNAPVKSTLTSKSSENNKSCQQESKQADKKSSDLNKSLTKGGESENGTNSN